MPGEAPGAKLPSPWKDFLGEVDKVLEKPLEIHCIGGKVLAAGAAAASGSAVRARAEAATVIWIMTAVDGTCFWFNRNNM
jgi:hypothetical protein